MLYLDPKPLFLQKGIQSPLQYLTKNGFSLMSARTILSGHARKIHRDHLERLCIVLRCELNDLFVWSPPSEEALPPDLPLYKLNRPHEERYLLKDLKNMNLEEVRELERIIKEFREKKVLANPLKENE